MAADPNTLDVVFVAFDGMQTLDLTGPYDVFAGANSALDELDPDRPRYRLHIASLDGGTVRTESGLELVTARQLQIPRSFHTLVVPGGAGTRAASNDCDVVAAVADLADRSRRTLSICSGAFIVAAAGLMAGKRVTTHWARAASLQRRFPDIDVDPEPIYVRDGDVWSSAGVTAGIDLALAVVEHDHGAEIAQTVARWLVMFLRRPGGQSQFAAPIWNERAEVGPVRQAQDLIDSTPGDDHRVGLLAQRVGMSERHFARRFTEQVGMSPARYVGAVRLDEARRALESTTDTIEAIAGRCGFGTAETMRRTFTRRIGASPDQYRQRFRPSTPERSPT